MNRDEFKTAYRQARLDHFKGGQSIGGLYFSIHKPPATFEGLRPFCLQFRRIWRAEIDPRPFYWRVISQQGASVSDRRFYVKRGRAIRRGGFKTIHPEGLRV